MKIIMGMAEQPSDTPRARGSIRARGTSLQVRVYAGADPETGQPIYLTETHTDPKEAEKARIRLVAAVDASRAPLAKGSFAAAVDKWLDELQDEVDAGEMTAQTLQYYRSLAEDHVIPVLGKIPMPKLDQQLVRAAERLYKSLKVCSLRCGGRMTIEHHASGRANSRILCSPRFSGEVLSWFWNEPEGDKVRMPIRKYPPELKERAVRLCRESPDRPLAQTADQLGINRETLRNWVQQDRRDRGGPSLAAWSSEHFNP